MPALTLPTMTCWCTRSPGIIKLLNGLLTDLNCPFTHWYQSYILSTCLYFIMKNTILASVVVALLAAAAFLMLDAPTLNNSALAQFEEFKATFARDYSTAENVYRFKVFSNNLEKIAKHNADPTQTYTLGITQFTDMTPEEFVGKILMQDMSDKLNTRVKKQSAKGIEAPSQVDWRTKGVLNPVKNQGQCGSCWAFSTTGALESNIAVSKGSLFNLSEQQLVDCCGVKGFQCQGCNGAWPEWAFNYINSAGITLQSEYSYTGVVGTCKQTPNAKKFLNSASPWKMLSDISAIKQSLGSSGPVSICVDASNWSMYKSGVFTNCGTKVLNHAVVAIGYSADGSWIVRNSWGSGWGEQGHIRLGNGNTCGLAEHALIPNLA